MFGGRPRIGDSDMALELFFDGLNRIVFIEDRKDLAHIESGDLAVALGGAAGRTVGSLKRTAAKLQKLGAVGLMAHERILDAAPTNRSSEPGGPFPVILIDRAIEWPEVLQPLMRIDAALRDRSGNPELRRAELVREILDNEGRIHVDKAAALDIGLDLARPLRIIYIRTIVELAPLSRARFEEAVGFELLDHDPLGTIVSDRDAILAVEGSAALMPFTDRLPVNLLARARAIPKVTEVMVGAGTALDGTEGMFRSLREARWAAQVGYRLRGPNHVMSFHDLGAYAWLEPIAFDRKDRAIAAIETIMERDRRQNTRLLATLQTYLDSRRLKEASDRLFVHRNTLRYRLEAIRKLTGHDVQDPEGRLVLELQLRLAMAQGLIARSEESGDELIDLTEPGSGAEVISLELVDEP
jgi:sugar diacid utilization regulator